MRRLYRSNAQSRVLEALLQASTVPHLRRYALLRTPKIKMRSYLRLIANRNDDAAF